MDFNQNYTSNFSLESNANANANVNADVDYSMRQNIFSFRLPFSTFQIDISKKVARSNGNQKSKS